MIKSIELENFKIHKKTKIEIATAMSIITGTNSSGKTSLLEALMIFQECYYICLTLDKSKQNGQESLFGDYKFSEKYILHFDSLRCGNYEELFFTNSSKFKIRVVFDTGNDNIDISFSVSKSRDDSAYKITPTIADKTLTILNTKYTPNNFISFIKSMPIANITQTEPYYTSKIIEEHISKGNSMQVMRNRLSDLDLPSRNLLQNQVKRVLNYDEFNISINFETKFDKYITTLIQADNMLEYQDLSLMGSGTLQLIEVLLTLNLAKNNCQQLLLLDEPDSHLHRNAQKQLIEILRESASNNIHIFATSHNEQIIANARIEELLHLEINRTNTMSIKSLGYEFQKGRSKGFIEELNRKKIYNDLGVSSSAMAFLDAIESDLIVFVEGRSDANYLNELHTIYRNTFPGVKKRNVKFWSIGGIDDLPKKLNYWKDILENIKNSKTLWEKSLLLIDLDYSTLDEVNIIKNEIANRYKIKVLSWDFYTIENLLLQDKDCFCDTYASAFSQDLIKVKDIVYNFINENANFADFEYSITQQRKAREKGYSILDKHQLKFNDAANFANYQKFIKNSSNSSVLLFPKDKIFELLALLKDKLELDYDFENEEVLLEMIKQLEIRHWQENWTEILKTIFG